MTFSERLERLIEKNKTTQKAVAMYAGVRYASISDWKKDGSYPRADIAIKIAEVLGTTVEELIIGKSREFSSEILEIAQKVADLPLQDREEVIILIDHKLKKGTKPQDAHIVAEKSPRYASKIAEIAITKPLKLDNNVQYISDKFIYTPYYGQTAAGTPISFEIPPETVVRWSQDFIKGDPCQYYTVMAKGDSMVNADIKDGDYVLMRNAKVPMDKKIMLIRHGEESTIKRIKMKGPQEVYMCWESLSEHEPIRLDDQEYEIQGEFVAIMRG